MNTRTGLPAPNEEATTTRTTAPPPPPPPQTSATENKPTEQTHNTMSASKPPPSVQHLKPQGNNLEQNGPWPNALEKPVNQYSPSVKSMTRQPHHVGHTNTPCPDERTHKEPPHKSSNTHTTLEPTPQKKKRKRDPPLHKEKKHPQCTHTPTPTTAQPHPSPQRTSHNPTTTPHKPRTDNPSHHNNATINPAQIQTLAPLIAALPTKDHHHIKQLIQRLPHQWSGHNTAGTLITKRQIIQSS